MSESLKKAVFGLGSIILCAGASAIVNDSANPYQGIVERNVFGLKPAPSLTENISPPVKDPPPITLTGITTILKTKRALLNVQSPGKPVQSFILAEGQREGDIEVVEIDAKAGSVKVNYAGTTVPLNFEKNGPKLFASSPGTTPPGAPGVAPVQLASANANPFANNNTGGLKTIQTRNWTPQAANQSAGLNGAGPGMNGNGANINPSFNGVPAPGFGPVTPISGSTQAQTPPVPTAIDPDVQAMQMLAHHVQSNGDGPPLPPPLAEVLGENTSIGGGPPVPQPTPQQTPTSQNPLLQRPPGLPPLPQ